MKLFYASGSPYARIIRVVLRETGRLDGRTVEAEVTLRDPNSSLRPFNPGARYRRCGSTTGLLNESLLVLLYLEYSA